MTGAELRATLERLGHATQTARAAAVGLARPTLSGYENEHLPVPPHLAERVRLMARVAELEERLRAS